MATKNKSVVGKRCGKCALCCKLIDVPGLAAKGSWCKHVNLKSENSCSIYNERPGICKGFECLWLKSKTLSDSLRPDKCGVVFEIYKEGLVVALVDKHKSDVWKKGEVNNLIVELLKSKYFVWVVVGKEQHLLLCEGVTEKEALQITKTVWKQKMGK